MRILYHVFRSLWKSALARVIGGAFAVVSIVTAILNPPSPDMIRPDGLSVRARACGSVLRDHLEEDVARFRAEGMPEEAIRSLQQDTLAEIRKIEKLVTETRSTDACAEFDRSWRRTEE